MAVLVPASLPRESSLKALMATELQLDTENLPATLRIMVCGAQSGQRAMELASYLDDVEVIADESLANIAKATRMANEMGMDNIVFWPWSIAQRFVADGHGALDRSRSTALPGHDHPVSGGSG